MRSLHLIVLSLFISIVLQGQKSSLYQEIKTHADGVGLWWVGHNGWIIKSGDLVISTDILLDYDKRINPPLITAEELAEILDVSFVTHGHNDHFNRAVSKVLSEKSDCIFVIPESCISIAEELGIPKSRLQVAKPRQTFELDGVQVEPIRAIHGNANFAIYYEANLQDCGYKITIDSTTFLQPGDSYLLEDHLFLQDIDVLFFSPTEHNMYIDRSVILINTLHPDFIFPQHHSTVSVTEATRFWAKGYPDEVKLRLSQPLQDRYYILREGDMVKIK
ncbi:MAG: MBL fold metallo-hydrolase [Saprospiraceae bacterium]|nr:MBL fold metallo-hydrolase [Saprospiraceae bacterium]